MKSEHETLFEARKRLGLTQQQVADKAQIHLQQYQKFESGVRKLSSSSLFVAGKVLRALELDITAFVFSNFF